MRAYSARLSHNPELGVLGLPELRDDDASLKPKVAQLVSLIRSSKHTVVLTGAGISRSCGIPGSVPSDKPSSSNNFSSILSSSDFRGPRGVWTRLDEERKRQRRLASSSTSSRSSPAAPLARSRAPEEDSPLSFEQALPSLTHMALIGLRNAGLLRYLVTQNVDNLHWDSGWRDFRFYAELHGNVKAERCPDCGERYLRGFDVGGMSAQETGRLCTQLIQDEEIEEEDSEDFNDGENSPFGRICGGRLIDEVLDWEDALPHAALNRTEQQLESCDLLLCIGTSLRVEPVSTFPQQAHEHNAKVVILNLQETPCDELASLLIRRPCDEVFLEVMRQLNLPIPNYERIETLIVEMSNRTLRVRNGGGYRAVYVSSVRVDLDDDSGVRIAELEDALDQVEGLRFLFDRSLRGQEVTVTVIMKRFCRQRRIVVKGLSVGTSEKRECRVRGAFQMFRRGRVIRASMRERKRLTGKKRKKLPFVRRSMRKRRRRNADTGEFEGGLSSLSEASDEDDDDDVDDDVGDVDDDDDEEGDLIE